MSRMELPIGFITAEERDNDEDESDYWDKIVPEREGYKVSKKTAISVLDTLHGIGNLNSYAIIAEDGTIWRFSSEPCYGSLYDRLYDEGKNVAYFVDWSLDSLNYRGVKEPVKPDDRFYSKPNPMTLKEVRHYINYCLKRSPFADAFVNKTAFSVFKHGTIIQPNVCMQHAITACTSIRYVAELPTKVWAWTELSKYMSEDAAFVLAHFMTPTYNDKKETVFGWSDYGGGHSLLYRLNLYGARNFIAHNIITKAPPIKDKCWDYSPLIEMWQKEKEGPGLVNPFNTINISIGTDWYQMHKTVITIDAIKKGIGNFMEKCSVKD